MSLRRVVKMLTNFTKTRYENLSPPRPSPRKAGGEGGDIRVTSHLLNTPISSSFQHLHQASLAPWVKKVKG